MNYLDSILHRTCYGLNNIAIVLSDIMKSCEFYSPTIS